MAKIVLYRYTYKEFGEYEDIIYQSRWTSDTDYLSEVVDNCNSWKWVKTETKIIEVDD